jgi:hypothetical protein
MLLLFVIVLLTWEFARPAVTSFGLELSLNAVRLARQLVALLDYFLKDTSYNCFVLSGILDNYLQSWGGLIYEYRLMFWSVFLEYYDTCRGVFSTFVVGLCNALSVCGEFFTYTFGSVGSFLVQLYLPVRANWEIVLTFMIFLFMGFCLARYVTARRKRQRAERIALYAGFRQLWFPLAQRIRLEMNDLIKPEVSDIETSRRLNSHICRTLNTAGIAVTQSEVALACKKLDVNLTFTLGNFDTPCWVAGKRVKSSGFFGGWRRESFPLHWFLGLLADTVEHNYAPELSFICEGRGKNKKGRGSRKAAFRRRRSVASKQSYDLADMQYYKDIWDSYESGAINDERFSYLMQSLYGVDVDVDRLETLRDLDLDYHGNDPTWFAQNSFDYFNDLADEMDDFDDSDYDSFEERDRADTKVYYDEHEDDSDIADDAVYNNSSAYREHRDQMDNRYSALSGKHWADDDSYESESKPSLSVKYIFLVDPSGKLPSRCESIASRVISLPVAKHRGKVVSLQSDIGSDPVLIFSCNPMGNISLLYQTLDHEPQYVEEAKFGTKELYEQLRAARKEISELKAAMGIPVTPEARLPGTFEIPSTPDRKLFVLCRRKVDSLNDPNFSAAHISLAFKAVGPNGNSFIFFNSHNLTIASQPSYYIFHPFSKSGFQINASDIQTKGLFARYRPQKTQASIGPCVNMANIRPVPAKSSSQVSMSVLRPGENMWCKSVGFGVSWNSARNMFQVRCATLPGDCGSLYFDSNNQPIGMHEGTDGQVNYFAPLSEDLFDSWSLEVDSVPSVHSSVEEIDQVLEKSVSGPLPVETFNTPAAVVEVLPTVELTLVQQGKKMSPRETYHAYRTTIPRPTPCKPKDPKAIVKRLFRRYGYVPQCRLQAQVGHVLRSIHLN